MPIVKNIYFTDHRKADVSNIPVILIHGAGSDHLSWTINIRRATQALTIDLPAHGKSLPPASSSMAEHAKAVIDFMDGLGFTKVIIGGHSMGGGIAQTIALDYPDRVAGLILVGTGAKLSIHPDILEYAQNNLSAVIAILSESLWSPGEPEHVTKWTHDQVSSLAPGVLYADYLSCDRFDVRDRLGEIAVPTLVIGARNDVMTPHKFSVYLADNLPHAELVTIEDTGHMLIVERPVEVENAITEWLVRKGFK